MRRGIREEPGGYGHLTDGWHFKSHRPASSSAAERSNLAQALHTTEFDSFNDFDRLMGLISVPEFLSIHLSGLSGCR